MSMKFAFLSFFSKSIGVAMIQVFVNNNGIGNADTQHHENSHEMIIANESFSVHKDATMRQKVGQRAH